MTWYAHSWVRRSGLTDGIQDNIPRPKLGPPAALSYDGTSDDPKGLLSRRSGDSQPGAASSKRSARSRSPQKNIQDTKLSSIPVETISLDRDNTPADFRSLMREIQDLAEGEKTLPREIADEILKDEDHVREFEWYNHGAESAGDPVDFYKAARVIWKRAADFHDRGVAEARWNGGVHYCLLDLALESDWKKKGV